MSGDREKDGILMKKNVTAFDASLTLYQNGHTPVKTTEMNEGSLSVEKYLILHQLSYMVGFKFSCHFSIQTEVKPKPIVTHSHTFSHPSFQLHVMNVFSLAYCILCDLCD